ncbi:O-antigen ligase family protein [Rhodocaloribacter sp.]
MGDYLESTLNSVGPALKEDRSKLILVGFFILAIAGYGLFSFIPDFFSIPGRNVTISYRAIILVLSLWVIKKNLVEGRYHVSLVYLLPVAIFWSLYIVRMIVETSFDYNPYLSLPWYEYYLYAIGTCLIPMVAFMGVQDDELSDYILKGLLAVLLIISIIGLYNNLVNIRVGSTTYQRGASAVLGGIWFGHIGSSLCLLSLYNIITSKPGQIWKIGIGVFMIAIGIIVIGVSLTRAAFFVLLVGLLFMIGIEFLKGSTKTVFRLTGLTLMGSLVVISYVDSFFQRFVMRIEQLPQQRIGRLEKFQGAWVEFSNHPIFGSGLELSSIHQYPHNIFLEAFMATGALGGTVFILMFLMAFYSSIKLAIYRPAWAWVSLLFVQYTIAAMSSGAIYTNYLTWILLGAVIGLGGHLVPERTRESRSLYRRQMQVHR